MFNLYCFSKVVVNSEVVGVSVEKTVIGSPAVQIQFKKKYEDGDEEVTDTTCVHWKGK